MTKQNESSVQRYFYLSYSYLFAFVGLVTIAFMFGSFIIGGYLVFDTEIGIKEMTDPIKTILLFLWGIPIAISTNVSLGYVFSVLWCIYIVFFAVALNGPKKSIIGVIRGIRRNGFDIYSNTAYLVVVVFSVLLSANVLIELIQRQVGVSTGTPPESSPIREFTFITLAPLVEEIGFRVTLIGVAAFLILNKKVGVLKSLKALWHPSKYLDELLYSPPSDRKPFMYFVIGASGLFFGASHIIYGSTWEIGKLSTATIAGIVLGWLYFKQGLPAALLTHWAFNYLSSSYVYFACANLGVTKGCEEAVQNNPLLTYFLITIMLTGVLSIGLIGLNKIFRSNAAHHVEAIHP